MKTYVSSSSQGVSNEYPCFFCGEIKAIMLILFLSEAVELGVNSFDLDETGAVLYGSTLLHSGLSVPVLGIIMVFIKLRLKSACVSVQHDQSGSYLPKEGWILENL